MSSNRPTAVMPVYANRLSDKYSANRPSARDRMSMIGTAFLAMCRRDLLVTVREFIPFLIQALMLPLFFLFIFGKVLPLIGAAKSDYAVLLLPGIIAMTAMTSALQGLTMSLTLDLGHAHEIEDRLLAPLPIKLVALEKVLFATLRGMIGAGAIFPLAAWVLGAGFQVRGDTLGLILSIMLLTSLAGAAIGLTLGSVIQPAQISIVSSIIFLPLIFLGCTYYPWIQLIRIPWFQIMTLFNPLTYGSEGLRGVMTPVVHGHIIPTMPFWLVLIGLSVSSLFFLVLGMQMFARRVVN